MQVELSTFDVLTGLGPDTEGVVSILCDWALTRGRVRWFEGPGRMPALMR